MPKLTDRSERLLLQALKESDIEEANETNQLPPLLGGTTVVYRRKAVNGDIIHSFTGGSAIRCFPKDTDAVRSCAFCSP